MSESVVTVRDLRRQWKPHKERLNGGGESHPTPIRFHRACSWLQRAEQIAALDDLDLTALTQWIAFNALYGQWDAAAQSPVGDLVSWKRFLDRMLQLDERGIIAETLQENRTRIMAIFEDEFLSQYFWKDPTDQRASRSKKTMYEARTWFVMKKWAMILERVVERIYFLRCQLVHGAATHNSQLNRTAIRHCTEMMDRLLRAFLLVWIHNGADEDWGTMCYPPLH